MAVQKPDKPQIEPQANIKPMILNNSVNFGFSRRTRDAYIAKELEKSQLDSSSVLSPKATTHTRGGSFVSKSSVDDSL